MEGSRRAMLLERPARAVSAPLRAVARDPQDPGPGQLLLRVAACGVCRTDLQLCEGDLAAHALPIVPGHQIVGRVEAVGREVAEWRAGDRAGVAWLAGADGTCDKCRSGHENLCERATFTGWDVDGGYATHAIARADFALRIPDGFDDLAAAPLLCGGVIGYRSLKRSGVAAGRPAWPLRLRGVGPHHAAARAALGLPRLRRHAFGGRTGARAVAGRGVGRGLRRPAARAARRGDHVRALGRRGPRCAARDRPRRARWRSTPSTSIACPRCHTKSCGGSAGWRVSRTSRAPTPRELLDTGGANSGTDGIRDAPARRRATSRWRGCLAARSGAPPSWCPSRRSAGGDDRGLWPDAGEDLADRRQVVVGRPQVRGRGRWCWSSRSRACRPSRSRRGRGPSPASRSPGTGCAGSL